MFDFPDLWAYVTSQLAKSDRNIVSAGYWQCAECCTSSTFVGFDLARPHVKAKLYWLLPSCQTVPALLTLLDGIFALCAAEGHFTRLRSFTSRWVRRDRLKLYSWCYFHEDVPFNTIQSYLTLNDAIELSDCFLDKFRGLWSCLLENTGRMKLKAPSTRLSKNAQSTA